MTHPEGPSREQAKKLGYAIVESKEERETIRAMEKQFTRTRDEKIKGAILYGDPKQRVWWDPLACICPWEWKALVGGFLEAHRKLDDPKCPACHPKGPK